MPAAASADEPARLTVCAEAGEGCDETSLAAALSRIPAGGTVALQPGTHTVTSQLTIRKPVSIVGPNAGIPATSDARGPEATITTNGALGWVLSIARDVNGITIQGVDFADAGIVTSRSADVTIADNRFGPRSGSGPIALIYNEAGGSNWTISGNRFEPGTVGGNKSAMNIDLVDGLRITDNVIANASFAGMNLSKDSAVVIRGNTFSNLAMQGIHLYAARGQQLIEGNVFDAADTANEPARGALIISNAETTDAEFVVTGNTFRGSNRAISLSSNLPASGATFAITENAFERNVQNLLNRTTSLHVDAPLNWWGSATPDFASQVTGSVTVEPYYTNAERTSRSDTVATSVTVVAPATMQRGAEFTATVAVAPAGAAGTLELLRNGEVIASGDAGTPLVASLSGLATGEHQLQGRFTPADPIAFAASSSAVASVRVSTVPPAAPAATASDLDDLIRDRGLDPEATAAAFTPAPGSGNADPDDIDPELTFAGELPWPDETGDHFVDVYAYSTPTYLGTFRVVDGRIAFDVDLSALAPGQHRLVFVGQQSGEMQVMRVSVRQSAGGTPVVEVVEIVEEATPGLADTGASAASMTVAGVASVGGAVLLIAGLALWTAGRRRRARA